jgi:hypothetical protein
VEHSAREPDAVLRRSPQASRAAGRACLGLLLALLLIAGLSACGGEESDSERISPRISPNFALMRTSPDGIPADITRFLRVPAPDMELSLARQVPLSLPGTYWLVPGAEHLCMVATTPGSPAVGTVCATVDEALRHGIANTSLDPASDERIIVGVVPDGTRAVRIQSRDSTASARVRNGSFVHRDSVPAPPDRVTLR